MKITIDINNDEIADSIAIVSVENRGGFFLLLEFSDGIKQLVDFMPFLAKSNHPAISKYKDEKLFNSYKIIDGNLNWNDYDMIFPISNLYEGKI